jgi:hypothetical protein
MPRGFLMLGRNSWYDEALANQKHDSRPYRSGWRPSRVGLTWGWSSAAGGPLADHCLPHGRLDGLSRAYDVLALEWPQAETRCSGTRCWPHHRADQQAGLSARPRGSRPCRHDVLDRAAAAVRLCEAGVPALGVGGVRGACPARSDEPGAVWPELAHVTTCGRRANDAIDALRLP